MRTITVFSAAIWLTACSQPAPPPPPPTVVEALQAGNYTLVDLSHDYYDGMPTIQLPAPLGQTPPFETHTISKYDEMGPAWYWNWFKMGEHTGTHVDAPNHWISGRDDAAVEGIDLNKLLCPAAVVDVRDQAAKDPDYMVSVEDLQTWEAENGEIPGNAMVVMNSGWDQKFSDPMLFLGVNDQGEAHAPGFSPEAARWLLENREVVGLATDTVSTDALGVAGATDPPYQVHIAMHEAGKYQIEMIAGLDQLPASGAYLMVAPIKLRGGSGAPARIFGLLP